MAEVHTFDDFGKHLTLWRKSRRLTIRECARQLDVSHAYLMEVEHGRRPPSERFLLNAGRLFGTIFTVVDCRHCDGKGATIRRAT